MLAVIDADQLIPADHPIRRVKPIVEAALKELEPIFATMYSEVGRRSIPPEHLLKACLLMAFYSIRSERQFCERLQYDLLFKWFLGPERGGRGLRPLQGCASFRWVRRGSNGRKTTDMPGA
jgi:transposase